MMKNDSTDRNELALLAFESAWALGKVDDFESAIPNEARSNPHLLIDLACVDLQNRIQSDADTRVESYTAVFPQLASDDLVVLELIRTEYSFHPDRHSLDAETYCERFPRLAHQIRTMFQIEFDGSGAEFGSQRQSEWHCAHCDANIEHQESGTTHCPECEHPMTIGRYELLERVGQGAFGSVYRARDPKLKRDVAVKIPRANRFLLPEEIERFLRESRNTAQLDHPGVVSVFDTGRHQGVPYIVSELLTGQTLAASLSVREFEYREAAELMVAISDAVEHAHQRGVIHRDLKPSNIMTSNDGTTAQPRVMDFGLARHSHSDVSVTIEGQAIGTPAYMSPEQARGDLANVGPRSDVYSLGVILYQLLCGEVPFRGNAQMLIQQVVHDDPAPPSRFRNRIPADLETICMKAISREESGRYGSVAALGEDLKAWLDDRPIQARRIGAVGKLWRVCRRRPAMAALSATLFVSVLAGLAGVGWQWRQAEAARMASEADLNDALESVDRVLGHLGSDTLADIPQAKQLRAEVLNDSLVFFERFRSRNPDDPRLAMQVASAHHQVAKIQLALGNSADAGQAYAAAVEGYENMERSAPDRKRWLETAASAYSGYASFLLRQSRAEESLSHQEKCLNLRQQLHAENPESGKFTSRYASARADLGRILARVSSDAEAEAEFELAIDQLEQLVANSDAVGYQRDLARVLHNYSIHLARVGKNGRAEQCRERAIGLLEYVIADDPKDESKRAVYANTCLQLVKKLRGENRLTAAKIYQDKAVAVYQSLTEDFPATPRHRERFASVLHEVGSMAATQKREQDMMRAYESAVRQREILVDLFPSKLRYRRALATDLDHLASALVSLNASIKAETRFRQKIEVLRGLPGEMETQDRIELLIGLRDLAPLLADSKSKEKIDESKSILAEADRLLADFSVEQILQLEVSKSRKLKLLSTFTRLAKQANDLPAVEVVYRAKIQLYQEGVDEDPEKLSRRSSLARQWSYLGQTLRQLKRGGEAIEAFQNAVRIDEGLVADDPDSAIYAGQMISHSTVLGHMLYFSGRPTEAAEVISRTLVLAKELYQERNNEAYREGRVVLAYKQLGDALALEGLDYAAAAAAYEEAASMSSVLRGQPGLEKFEATFLNGVAWFFLTCPDKSLRQPERALELARQAVAINPSVGSNVATLGFALHATGDYKKAIERFREANELDTLGRPLNTMLIAICQAKSEQTEKAKDTFAEAVRLNELKSSEPELFELYKAEAEKLVFE